MPLGQHRAGVRQAIGTKTIEDDAGAYPWQRIAGKRPLGALEPDPVGSHHPDQPIGCRSQLALEPVRRVPDVSDDRWVAEPGDLRQPAAVEARVGTAQVEAIEAACRAEGSARQRRISERAESPERERRPRPTEVKGGQERSVLGVGIDEERRKLGLGEAAREAKRDEATARAPLGRGHDDQARARQLPTAANACSGELIGAEPAGGAGAVVSTAASCIVPAA